MSSDPRSSRNLTSPQRISDFFGDSKILIWDGSNSTELYERGFYINRPFEELNLNAPQDVLAVHLQYIQSGAQVLSTNSFATSSPQLQKFDIGDDQKRILFKSLQIANQARSHHPQVKICLSLGPLGVLVEPLGPTSLEEVQREFASIAKTVNEMGELFEGYSLDSFSNVEELKAAVEGIRSVDSKRFLLASYLVEAGQHSRFSKFAEIIERHSGVDAVGIDGAEGPSELLKQLGILNQICSKPIVVRPTAGIPRHLNNRYFYMTSPDYLAKFARRYAEAGARGIGGSSGIGPKHIEAVRSALQMVEAKESGQKNQSVHVSTLTADDLNPRRSVQERANVSPLAKDLESEGRIISIEISSPKGTNLETFFKNLDLLKARGIRYVNVPDGARASTRCSSLHLATKVANHPNLGITVIPHFTTRDRNLIALQSDLIGASINGVSALLLVTGDPPRLGNNKDATGVYDIDSIGLTHLVDCLNRGSSPKGDRLGSHTDFVIGVASNPTASNLKLEIDRWKYKVEMGADMSITQPIYDPDSYFRWLDLIGATQRPFLVGIWPLISMRNAEFMANEVPGVYIPKSVLEEIAKAGTDPVEAQKRGRDIALKTIQKIGDAAKGFAISAPLGKIEAALALLDQKGNTLV